MMNKESLKLADVLIKDYELTNEKIEQFMRNQVKFLSAAFAFVATVILVIGASISQGWEGYYWILMMLPVFMAIYLGLILYHYQRTMALQGYKKYLEEQINKFLGSNYLSYGYIGMDVMEENNRFRKFNAYGYTVIMIMALLSTFYGIYKVCVIGLEGIELAGIIVIFGLICWFYILLYKGYKSIAGTPDQVFTRAHEEYANKIIRWHPPDTPD